MKDRYYSSERLKEITYTNEIQQDLCIYDRKNQDKLMTLIHDMDLIIINLQQENKQLKDNWNELKEYIDNQWLDDKGIITRIKDRIELIEKGDSNE